MDDVEYKCIELRRNAQDVLTICSDIPMVDRVNRMNKSAIEMKNMLIELTGMNEKECAVLAVDIAIDRRSYNDICTLFVCA